MNNNFEHDRFGENVLPIVRYANPGTAREMSTASLNSGQPYQRPVEPSDVDITVVPGRAQFQGWAAI